MARISNNILMDIYKNGYIDGRNDATRHKRLHRSPAEGRGGKKCLLSLQITLSISR